MTTDPKITEIGIATTQKVLHYLKISFSLQVMAYVYNALAILFVHYVLISLVVNVQLIEMLLLHSIVLLKTTAETSIKNLSIAFLPLPDT